MQILIPILVFPFHVCVTIAGFRASVNQNHGIEYAFTYAGAANARVLPTRGQDRENAGPDIRYQKEQIALS
jgi:hypothetical protein